MTLFFCLSDENGRNESIKLCKDLLVDPRLNLRLIPCIVDKLPRLIECPKVRTRTVAEWVSDIRNPLDDDGDEPKTDPEIIKKCLTILKYLLRSPDITKIDSTLQTVKDHVILPSFTVNNTNVLCLAQDTLGQLCQLDLNLAKEQFLNYCIQLTDEPTIKSTVSVILDILAVHGLNFVDSNQSCISSDKRGITNLNKDESFDSETIKSVIQTIVDLFEHKEPEISSIAVKGIARLYFTSNLRSPYIFGYFTLIWFCPERYDSKIRSILSAFFMGFIQLNCDADIIIESVIPILKTIKKSKKNDNWYNINERKVSMFLIHLLSKECWTEKALSDINKKGSFHCRLAQILCRKSACSSTLAAEIAYLLDLIELDADDGKYVTEMLSDLKKAIKITNRTVDNKTINIYKKFEIEVDALQTNYLDIRKKHTDKEIVTLAKKARLSGIVEVRKDKETIPLESFVYSEMETNMDYSPQKMVVEKSDDSDVSKYIIEGTDDSESD